MSAVTVGDGTPVMDVQWRQGKTGAVNSKEFTGVKLPLWTHPAGTPEDENTYVSHRVSLVTKSANSTDV